MMNEYYFRVVEQWVEDNPSKDVHAFYDRLVAMGNETSEFKAISTGVIRQAEIAINHIITSLHPREHISILIYPESKSKHSPKWGGYWDTNNFELGIKISDADLRAAIVDGFYGAITGETSDVLYQAIYSTLSHEYAHFVQTVLGSYKRKSDRGLTPSDSKRRNNTATAAGYFSYIGALHEIDSFASQIAAEIVNGNRNSIFGMSKELIRDLQSDLSLGHSVSRHQKDIMSYLDGVIDKKDASSNSAQLVKNRLLKLIVSKLDDYVSGNNPMLERYPSIWNKFSKLGTKKALDRITSMVDDIEYDDLDGHSYQVVDFLIDSGLIPENKFDQVRDIAYRLMVEKKKKYDSWS